MRGGDTLSMISDRFGVEKGDIRRHNPKLWGDDMTHAEQVIALKYDTPPHGGVLYCGYYYRGTPEERLRLALQISDYITVSSSAVRGDEIKCVFDDREVVERIRGAGVVPYMRVYRGGAPFSEALAIKAARRALELGYLGIATDVCREEGGKWLESASRIAHESGLLFMCECDRPCASVDGVADHTVLFYDKLAESDIPSFKDGEEAFFREYHEKCDPTRTFIDLPSLVYTPSGMISYREAMRTASRSGRRIEYDPRTMVCQYETKRCRGKSVEDMTVRFESIENIKARLGLLAELGFMGIEFDIMRVPTEYLLLAFAMHAPTSL